MFISVRRSRVTFAGIISIVCEKKCWWFAWDQGERTIPELRKFEGAGTAVVEIEPVASHAVRNDGQRPLLIFAMTNGVYDPASPDSYSRIVLAASRV
jgi:hypothetical protein